MENHPSQDQKWNSSETCTIKLI